MKSPSQIEQSQEYELHASCQLQYSHPHQFCRNNCTPEVLAIEFVPKRFLWNFRIIMMKILSSSAEVLQYWNSSSRMQRYGMVKTKSCCKDFKCMHPCRCKKIIHCNNAYSPAAKYILPASRCKLQMRATLTSAVAIFNQFRFHNQIFLKK